VSATAGAAGAAGQHSSSPVGQTDGLHPHSFTLNWNPGVAHGMWPFYGCPAVGWEPFSCTFPPTNQPTTHLPIRQMLQINFTAWGNCPALFGTGIRKP